MQSLILNTEKLRLITNASHTAEVTMTALGMRERLRLYSDIPRTRNSLIRDGEKIIDEDYVDFWKGLQLAGAGTIVFGRKGKPDRFHWHYSMKKVAQAALEGKTLSPSERLPEINDVKKVATKKVVSLKSLNTIKSVSNTNTISEKFAYVNLRPNFCLEFSVPSDLSKSEVEVITRALFRMVS